MTSQYLDKEIRPVAKVASLRIADIEKRLDELQDRQTTLLSRVETNLSEADWAEYGRNMREIGELSKLIETLP